MPELPEVETVKRALIEKVRGRKILDVNVKYMPIIAYPKVANFIEEIVNQTINDIDRRGKLLIFKLDNYDLISHLRMEGKYFIKSADCEISKHEHVIFKLDNDKELRYHDTRKFGKMYLVKKGEITNTPILKLGLEPWDKNLTKEYLKIKLAKNIAVKTLLLDQSIIAGIGNIYADEILFLSRINPTIKGINLTDENLLDIIKYTREILTKAISFGGTTIHTYTSVDGITGRFQQELLVHGKEFSPCPNCHGDIRKIFVNKRGTYFCPKCQK